MFRRHSSFTGQLLLTVTYLVTGFVEFMLGLRVFMKLFGASTVAPFVQWVYETTAPLLQPFAGIFPSPRIEGRFIIEFSALFALVVYVFIAYAVEYVLSAITKTED